MKTDRECVVEKETEISEKKICSLLLEEKLFLCCCRDFSGDKVEL